MLAKFRERPRVFLYVINQTKKIRIKFYELRIDEIAKLRERGMNSQTEFIGNWKLQECTQCV